MNWNKMLFGSLLYRVIMIFFKWQMTQVKWKRSTQFIQTILYVDKYFVALSTCNFMEWCVMIFNELILTLFAEIVESSGDIYSNHEAKK